MSLGPHNKDGAITHDIKKFGMAYPLALAIIIDIIKIIPYVDCVITIWLQIILWREIASNEYLQWMCICYDLADFPGMVHPYADVVPLNTISIVAMLIYTRIPYNV